MSADAYREWTGANPKAPRQPKALPQRSIAVKRPPLGSPPCPKVFAKVAVATGVFPKNVIGTSIVYNEIYISEYPMLPWYFGITVSFIVLVLLLAMLKIRDLIRDHKWSAMFLFWSGSPHSEKPEEPTASEDWTMVPDVVSSSEDEEVQNPVQLINLYIAGAIDGIPKLHVVPGCRGLKLQNHHVCRLDKALGIGNEYWCKNCNSTKNIIDEDPLLLKELFCHQGKLEVRKASLFLPLGSFPAVARRKLQSDEDVTDPQVDMRMQFKKSRNISSVFGSTAALTFPS